MSIKMRRGNLAQLDKAKLQSGEWAVTNRIEDGEGGYDGGAFIRVPDGGTYRLPFDDELTARLAAVKASSDAAQVELSQSLTALEATVEALSAAGTRTVCGTCSSAATETVKAVPADGYGERSVGDVAVVRFDAANDTASPMLEVGSSEAAPIVLSVDGSTVSPVRSEGTSWNAGSTVLLVWDGTSWTWPGGEALCAARKAQDAAAAALAPQTATTQRAGVVRIGNGLEISADGTLSVAGYTSDSLLVYDKETGRYTNDSVVAWLEASYDIEGVYGVRVPRFASGDDTCAKTGDNEGLVLEPSSETVKGRNDYKGIALFACPRCNGGADADGMPYVTAIEDVDSRFDAAGANTYAITPVYNVTHTEGDGYDLYEYEYGEMGLGEACAGAYTAGGEPRPFILRACYMDSDGDCSSRSGTMPASSLNYDAYEDGSPVEYYYDHTPQSNWEEPQGRGDGLSYLCYGDVAYLMDMMMLMLGTKAPKSAAAGSVDNAATYDTGCTLRVEGSRAWVEIPEFQNDIFKGGRVSIGEQGYTWYMNYLSTWYAHSAKVLEVADGCVYIDPASLSENASDYETVSVWAGYWENGSCDAVRGTFGTPDLDHLVDGKAPFRFQNVEWGLGKAEIVANMVAAKRRVGAFPDIRATEIRPFDIEGFCIDGTLLDAQLPTSDGYIADYTREKGAWVPAGVGAASSTGCRAFLYQNAVEGRSWLVGGAANPEGLSGTADPLGEQGPGFVHAQGDGRVWGHWLGARSSTIGLSSAGL